MLIGLQGVIMSMSSRSEILDTALLIGWCIFVKDNAVPVLSRPPYDLVYKVVRWSARHHPPLGSVSVKLI